METAIRTKTEILVYALKVLSNEIQSEDGIANTAILEGAQRLDELNKKNGKMRRALQLIVEDSESWLNGEADNPSVDFIKLVVKYAKETLEEIK